MKVKRVAPHFWSVMAGAAVGAGVALLFAPHSGQRTRRLIRRTTDDVGDDVREMYKRIKETGDDAARRLGFRLRMRLTPKISVKHLTGEKAG